VLRIQPLAPKGFRTFKKKKMMMMIMMVVEIMDVVA
jgi:hypothetical protein